MQASIIIFHDRTPKLWSFHGLMLNVRHSVIIQMDEAVPTFYNKWLDIDTKQELFRYLIMDVIGKQRNTWDIDLVKLFHLSDPECDMHTCWNRRGTLWWISLKSDKNHAFTSENNTCDLVNFLYHPL